VTGGDIEGYVRGVALAAREASRAIRVAPTAARNRAIAETARLLAERRDSIKAANARDHAAARLAGLARPMLDRLLLSDARIDEMIRGAREIAAQEDPLGEVIGVRRPGGSPGSGLTALAGDQGFLLEKVRVPIGVVAIIYESRPNVTLDAACLCIKSGNACILRSGKEAMESGRAITSVIAEALGLAGLPGRVVQYVERTEHEGVSWLVRQTGLVDLVVPRGGEALIRRVVADATVPVIKHFKGICHLYVDRAADLAMALELVANSKLQRVEVCNTLESVLVHAEVAAAFLPRMAERLAEVELRGCERTRGLVPRAVAATEEDYGTEYLDKILSVKVVGSLEEAVSRIERYGSQHTDGIVTGDLRAADAFVAAVDSAVVTVNASTRLSDGGVFGLGAEIGISTDKLHARGPMGVRDLTTYKWVVRGDGALRT
jgi:glutamate-5-semialdehyde dehydrogenase